MKITRACDYTIRALIIMARSPFGTVFMRSDLAKKCQVPDSFLGKLFQGLAKSKILVSERGKNGGFKLGMYPNEINMYDVVVAVDGPLNINTCLKDDDDCIFIENCYARNMWLDVQDAMILQLKKYTLEDISKDTNTHDK